MAHVRRRVQRPNLLAVYCLFALAVHVVAGAGLLRLRDLRTASPKPIVAAAEVLSDALGDSPWTGARDARAVWLLTSADCKQCARLETQVLGSLPNQQVGVRVLVVAPQDLGETRLTEAWMAAALSSARNAPQNALATPSLAGLSYVESSGTLEEYVERGRVSLDRVNAVLLANGVEPELPMLLWRNGAHWRVLTGQRALSIDAVRRDFALEG